MKPTLSAARMPSANLPMKSPCRLPPLHPHTSVKKTFRRAVIEHEEAIAAAKAREEGKKEDIIPRIVEGSLKKFKNEMVLMRQVYIRDENITIDQLLNQTIAATGENIIIRRFARFALGEGKSE